MPRKAKKKIHKMPPLSFVDKAIYWTILLLLCASYIALLLGPFILRHKIAFADESVIAVADNISILWLVVPFINWTLITSILWGYSYYERKPIFGKKGFRYGPPAWLRVYQLFMKNKPQVFVSTYDKKRRKGVSTILAIVLIVGLIPFPLSLYGRDCLRQDGSIVQYNMFNREVYNFSAGDIREIKFGTYRHKSRGDMFYSYGVQMVLITDSGKKYTFQAREFHSDGEDDARYWLKAMSDIKRRYDPSIIRYEDSEKLDKVAKSYIGFTDKDREWLYQLFEQP